MTTPFLLVCDDNPTLRSHVAEVLTKADFLVRTSDSKTAASALLEAAPAPALVLLGDWWHTEIGDPFFTALRAAPGLGELRVLGLGLPEPGGEPDTRPRPREIADVLPRPFAPEALLAVVRHLCDAGRDPAAPRPATDLGSLSLVPESQAPLESDEAAMSGDLSVISLADVLSLLEAEAQTGALTIKRADAHLRIWFGAGRIELATADGVPEEFLLGRFLVRGGALAAPTLATALAARTAETAAGAHPALLGTFLVDRGYVGLPALRRVLALQSAALIFESLRWGAGRFAFRPLAELPAPAQSAALALAVPALLLEGFRRVDEWRLIEREVGDFDGVFVREEERLEGFGRGRLTREEQAVLELCDGRRTVREIIEQASRRAHLGAFDATKMIYRLARIRLIRKRVPPVAMPA